MEKTGFLKQRHLETAVLRVKRVFRGVRASLDDFCSDLTLVRGRAEVPWLIYLILEDDLVKTASGALSVSARVKRCR
jgi:hypothetical protein